MKIDRPIKDIFRRVISSLTTLSNRLYNRQTIRASEDGLVTTTDHQAIRAPTYCCFAFKLAGISGGGGRGRRNATLTES